MTPVSLLVIAKAPLPGRAKTRLTPPMSERHAADLAAAALLDTLRVVSRTPAARRVVVFEGDPTDWVPEGFDVIPQRGGGLAERLAAAFEDTGGPALLIGMDTPQLTPQLLRAGTKMLCDPGVDAVLGPADDGGYWSVGLKQPNRAVFEDVPMSRSTTCDDQRARIKQLGLSVHEQPRLRDVDTIEDARAVANQVPTSRFARTLAAIERAA